MSAIKTRIREVRVAVAFCCFPQALHGAPTAYVHRPSNGPFVCPVPRDIHSFDRVP